MTRFRLGDVADATGAELVRGEPDAVVDGVETDTRSLSPGSLFLALRGPNFDGNRFADHAVGRGAGALLLARDEGGAEVEAPAGAALLVHPDPRRALRDLAAWHRARLACPVIGITGSCGKTTTKNVLLHLLGSTLRVAGSPRSFNNDIGVPLSLLAAPPDADAVVLELGTNQPGEIASLCRIARPTAGVITNVGAAHLAGLGSVEGVAREKGDLARAVPPDGFVVVDADGRFRHELVEGASARVIEFSVDGAAELNATDVWFHSGGSTFRLDGTEITFPLLGLHNVQNLMAALAVCVGLGVDLERVLPAISTLEGARQRMERLELGGVTVFDDSYNSNPDSARAAVRVLAGLHGYRRRVLVLGDMLELGEFEDEMHHDIGLEAAAAGIDQLLLVGERARSAAQGARQGGLPAAAVVHVETTLDAVRAIGELVGDGDVVLIKGSRGMALERIVGRLRDMAEVEVA